MIVHLTGEPQSSAQLSAAPPPFARIPPFLSEQRFVTMPAGFGPKLVAPVESTLVCPPLTSVDSL